MRIVRPDRSASIIRLLSEAETDEPTYLERGGTLRRELPAGYQHGGDDTVLGHGPEVFTKASEGLSTWQAHRFPGLRVFPVDAPLRTGTTIVVTWGIGIGAIAAPCRIVAVIDEPRRFGFAYGTLPGHPEQGEESFMVTLGGDDVVRFEIKAFSRPGRPATRLVGPLGRALQSAATKRYLRALHRFVDRAVPV